MNAPHSRAGFPVGLAPDSGQIPESLRPSRRVETGPVRVQPGISQGSLRTGQSLPCRAGHSLHHDCNRYTRPDQTACAPDGGRRRVVHRRTGTSSRLSGPNGAGKSPSLKIITGLATPTRGSVRISGRLYRDLPVPLLDASAVHDRRTAHHHLLALAVSNGLATRRVCLVVDQTGGPQGCGRQAGGWTLPWHAATTGIAAALIAPAVNKPRTSLVGLQVPTPPLTARVVSDRPDPPARSALSRPGDRLDAIR